MELPAELQGTILLILNAAGGFVVWKLKQYKDQATRAERREDAIVAAIDDALADDGEISKPELKRIVHLARSAH